MNENLALREAFYGSERAWMVATHRTMKSILKAGGNDVLFISLFAMGKILACTAVSVILDVDIDGVGEVAAELL